MTDTKLAERIEALEGRVFDKNGRAIAVGDVLKVYHFTGARRKRHYMHKQVIGTKRLNPSGEQYLVVSHLTLGRDRDYYLAIDGKRLPDHEIVQGLEANWEDTRAQEAHNG